MISRRSRLSLVQYLSQINAHTVRVLLKKHEVLEHNEFDHYPVLAGVLDGIIRPAEEPRLASLLDEIARTQNSLYASRTGNRDIYAERYADVIHCLLLDGYTLEHQRFQAIDPTTQDDAQAIEDELTAALRVSGLPRAEEIVRMLNASTEGFRLLEPDLNAVLTNARIALQTLATDIARERLARHPHTFDQENWGPLIEYLRLSGFMDAREERGVAGVFTFVSPGAHQPLDISRTDMARLGRALVFMMCWFLVKRHAATRPAARGAEPGFPRGDLGF